MLNKNPIFINGFQRGGTTLLVNLLASHPDVCELDCETHELFYSQDTHPLRKWLTRLFYFPLWGPIWISARQHIFLTIDLSNRPRIPKLMMSYIDLLFYWRKLNNSLNQYKFEEIKYVPQELKNSRFLSKNVNGVVMATDVLSQMYHNATFIALVRNGLALCESFIYRGYTAEACGIMYEKICQKMIHDRSNINNYYIVRFEDMVDDPISFTKLVYKYADLDFNLVNKFRLKARKFMDKDGNRKCKIVDTPDTWLWVNHSEIEEFFQQSVNENQINRLSKQDKDIFLKHAGKSMEYFGYI